MSSDSAGYLLNIPGNIEVISESDFYANDSTTDVSKTNMCSSPVLVSICKS